MLNVLLKVFKSSEIKLRTTRATRSANSNIMVYFAGVGLVPYGYSLDAQPGWNPESVGYHADNGR